MDWSRLSEEANQHWEKKKEARQGCEKKRKPRWCLGQETGMYREEGETNRGDRAQGSSRSASVGTLLSSSCVHEPPFLFHLPRDAGG